MYSFLLRLFQHQVDSERRARVLQNTPQVQTEPTGPSVQSRNQWELRDMENNVFWIKFWRVCFTFMLGVIASIAGCVCYQDRQTTLREELMIKSGYRRERVPSQFTTEWVIPSEGRNKSETR